ncbi:MAG: transglutaminase domain-containing protein [Candidatus Bipolaricaulota bacterium]
MRKLLTLIGLLLSMCLLVSVSCVPSDPVGPPEPLAVSFIASSPVAQFTDEDIAFLGLDLSGSPAQLADAIRVWQEDTWTYAADLSDFDNVADPIRWNYFLPGIYTSRDIIHEQVRDGRIYGICFSYAVVYCSVAEYYGLETRIMSTVSRISDSDPNISFTTGMPESEYNRLKVKLEERGLQYHYEAVRLVAEETPGHYWAEVKLDSAWVIQDATQKAVGFYTTAALYSTGDYQLYDWVSLDRSAALDEYQRLADTGQPALPETGDDGPFPSQSEGYTGMTDDLGQAGRAANIDDLMQGRAPAPYFSNAGDAYTYIGFRNAPEAFIAEDQFLIDEYKRLTGDEFYLVALLVCDAKPDDSVGECYHTLCGEDLDVALYLELKFGGN